MIDHYQVAIDRYEAPYKHFENKRLVGHFYHMSIGSVVSLRDLTSDISGNLLTLKATLACPIFYASELIYYPELAEYLRGHKDYRSFEREYLLDIPEDLEDLDFMKKFTECVINAIETFNAEGDELTATTNKTIERLIRRREPIIIESLDGNTIVISGIEYEMQNDSYAGVSNRTLCLALHDLFDLTNIIKDPRYINFVNFKPGTPFVDVRIKDEYYKSGRVNWMNIDAMEKVNSNQMKKFKKER